MTTIFIIILFIIQMISFYFLALFYTKLSKFDDLEKKQRQLMTEMDDSIAAYLAELKDENDRLINELDAKAEKRTEQQDKRPNIPLEKQRKDTNKAPIFDVKTPVIPLSVALKSYSKPTSIEPEFEAEPKLEVQEELEADDRTRAIRLFDAGESVEEIAKTLGKGRTEVELILKFR